MSNPYYVPKDNTKFTNALAVIKLGMDAYNDYQRNTLSREHEDLMNEDLKLRRESQAQEQLWKQQEREDTRAYREKDLEIKQQGEAREQAKLPEYQKNFGMIEKQIIVQGLGRMGVNENSELIQALDQAAKTKRITKGDVRNQLIQNYPDYAGDLVEQISTDYANKVGKDANYANSREGRAQRAFVEELEADPTGEKIVDRFFRRTKESMDQEAAKAAKEAAGPAQSIEGYLLEQVKAGNMTLDDAIAKYKGAKQQSSPLEKVNRGGVPTLVPREEAVNQEAYVEPTLRSVAPGGSAVDSRGNIIFTSPNKPASTTVNVGGPESVVASAEKKATEKLGEQLGARVQKRYEQGEEADRQNVQLDQVALALSRGAKTGAGQETILAARKYLQTMGIDTGNLSDQELIQKISNEMALRLRNPESGLGLTGNTSNKDLDFLKSSVVGLNRTEEGNRVIIEAMRQYNRLRKDVAIRQAQIIEANNGVVPLNLEKQLMEYVNEYQLFTDSERAQIEKFMKSGKVTSGITTTGRRPLPTF